MVQHYGAVNGNAQAGAVTYFGFLSFFPILALGFFVIGLVAQLYPDIKAADGRRDQRAAPGRDRHRRRARSRSKTIEDYSGHGRADRSAWCCCTPAWAGCRACARPSR